MPDEVRGRPDWVSGLPAQDQATLDAALAEVAQLRSVVDDLAHLEMLTRDLTVLNTAGATAGVYEVLADRMRQRVQVEGQLAAAYDQLVLLLGRSGASSE